MSRPMQPRVAIQAMRRLIADPEQTHEVFTIVRALSGPSIQRGYQRFADTETGQQIVREQRDILTVLRDQDYLASLPADSLGRHYLHFILSENLSAEGLVDASNAEGYDDLEPKVALFARRQRDTHDLFHTLTRYGRDQLGEACLLAFTYAQTKNRGIGFICLVGLAKLAQTHGAGVFRAGWRAYRDGKRSAWLPGLDWESLLAEPIDSVRRTLRIVEPTEYQEVLHVSPTPA